MTYHERIKRLTRENKVAVQEMYWLAGVSIDSIPDGLRTIIEESDPQTLADVFGADVEGFLHPEEFTAEDFLGVLFQLGASLDGFLARVGFPARYYNAEGEVIVSASSGYMQDFVAGTPEELVDAIESAVEGFDALDKETGDQVRQGIPLFEEGECGCECEECTGHGEEEE